MRGLFPKYTTNATHKHNTMDHITKHRYLNTTHIYMFCQTEYTVNYKLSIKLLTKLNY